MSFLKIETDKWNVNKTVLMQSKGLKFQNQSLLKDVKTSWFLKFSKNVMAAA